MVISILIISNQEESQRQQLLKIVTRGRKLYDFIKEWLCFSFSVNANDIKNTKYTSIWKAYDHDMVATDIDISTDGSVVLCTRSGTVFIKSTLSSNQRKTP